ncbi:MAG: ROK family transcriptional regulator [Rhizobiaceae bacterium]
MTTIARSDDLRIRNRHRVMTAIRRAGSLSRIDIARSTGLSAATVTAIAAELVELGVLIRKDGDESRRFGRGRPKVALSINPAMAVVVSTVFKMNTLSSRVFDYAGQTVSEHQLVTDTSSLGVADIRALLADSIRQALARSGTEARLKRIVVGVQGTTDIDGQTMLWSPITEHRDLPIAAWLSADLDVPVQVWNDCNMIAQSLHWQEPEEFDSDFAAVLLSYGVGMGLFQNGEPMNGSHSSGMEFGHMTYIPHGAPCRCGNRGCIEAYAGDYAIRDRAGGATADGGQGGIDAILEAARAGDKNAEKAITEAGAALGTGLANLFALTDPLPVALVGSGARAFELLEQAMREALRNSMTGEPGAAVKITCYPDEMPIVHNGCAINALEVVDRQSVSFAPGREADALV